MKASTGPVAHATVSRRVLLLFDFARGRSALLSIGEPALGAFLAAGRVPTARVLVLGFFAAACGFFCIYALNDLLDLRSDREEVKTRAAQLEKEDVAHMDILTVRHPIAAGALSLRAGITWVATLGAAGFACAYLLRPICAVLFVVCALMQLYYCGLKRKSWLKVIPAAAMVAVGALAGWFAVGSADLGALAFFFLLYLWETSRNLANDLADVTHDKRIGITTLASTHGSVVAARGILGAAIAIVAVGLLQGAPWLVRGWLAAVALGTMTIPALILYRNPDEPSAQRYFNRGSLFPPVAALGVLVIFLATGRFG
jgi:4-hydroxybenzoate polyprenyltransferase